MLLPPAWTSIPTSNLHILLLENPIKITVKTIAITALTTSASRGSKSAIPAKLGIISESMDDSAYGKKGANIAMPARRQATKLIKLHDKRIILGLGISVKSAPFIPFDSEIAPNAKIKKTASH